MMMRTQGWRLEAEPETLVLRLEELELAWFHLEPWVTANIVCYIALFLALWTVTMIS